MDQGAEDGSLFEGMDFVLSVEEAPASIPAPKAEENNHTNAGVQRLPSEPLDEDLFTGLSMIPGESGAETRTETLSAEVVTLENLLAGPKLVSSAFVNSSSKSGRKKKRSVRIGYGREPDDADEREASIELESGSRKFTEIPKLLVAGLPPSPELEGDEASNDDNFRISVSNSEVSRQETESDFTDVPDGDEKEAVVEEVHASQTEALQVAEQGESIKPENEQSDSIKVEGDEKSDEKELDAAPPESITLVEADRPSTMDERLEEIQLVIRKKLEELEVEAAEASVSRKLAAQVRREASVALSAAAAKRKELEVELENACEREDFELADRLSDDVAAAEQSLLVADTSFKDAEVKYDEAAAAVERILGRKIVVEEEGALELEKLQAEAEEEAERLLFDATDAATKLNESLSAEEEQLNEKNSQYVSQLRELEEAKSELDQSVREATEPDVREKDSILAERQVLLDELQELLEQVRAKESEIAMRDRALEAIDVKIASTTGEFEGNQAALETGLRNVNSLLEELQEQRSAIEAARKDVEEKLAMADVECQNLKNTAGSAASEAQALKEALERRRKVAEFSRDIKSKKAQLVREEEELLSAAQAFRQQGTTARAALQELSSTKLKLQQDISSAKQKIAYLEKRGPELESEKRLAAAARNFKEAARLSAEAKALLAEKEAATGELQKRSSEIQKLEEDIEAKIEALAELETMISLKEKDAARACCERLRLVAAAARDEKEVAMELEDFQEAENLEAEAAAADGEADELQRIHEFEGHQFQKHVSENVESA